MDGQILATTLPAEDRPALVDLVRRAEDGRNVTLRTEEYVALPVLLSSALVTGDPAAAPVALILRSRTEQLRFLRAIHTELAVTAIVAGAARHAPELRGGADDHPSARGDHRRHARGGGHRRSHAQDRPARGPRDDEDARLLATTFNTLTDSIARFQREMSQKERLSSLGRLSTVIAHEVRNPLMIIKAALHALRQRDLSPDAVREAAADIDDEVVRLNRIVNEVLDFARPIRFELAPTDLNALCRDSAAAAAAAPGPAIQLDLDPALPIVTTDAERLRLALVNLLVNARQAVDADPPGGPRVFLSTRAADGHISILVADTGSGIASADLSRVFDPYFTTKRGGTGLGLPIAKNIVDGLGGTIAVASAPGRGTEIRIDLPARRPPRRGRMPPRPLTRHARPPRRRASRPRADAAPRLDPPRRRRREDPEGARPGAARGRPRGDRDHQRPPGAAPARRAAVRSAARRQRDAAS